MGAEQFKALMQQMRLEEIELNRLREIEKREKQEYTTFRKAWDDAYPSNVPDELVRQQATNNLMELGKTVRDRLWDFYLCEILNDPTYDDKLAYVHAAEIVLYASMKNEAAVGDYLSAEMPVINIINNKHFEVFRIIEERARMLPLLPALKKTDLARLLNRPRYEIDNWHRAEKLKTPDHEIASHRKRWRFSDQELQREALEKFREKFPEYFLRSLNRERK
jgi:hypothetical protein